MFLTPEDIRVGSAVIVSEGSLRRLSPRGDVGYRIRMETEEDLEGLEGELGVSGLMSLFRCCPKTDGLPPKI